MTTALAAPKAGRISKLYPKIARCLKRNGNRWMTRQEIAEQTGLTLMAVYHVTTSSKFKHFDCMRRRDPYLRYFYRLSPMARAEKLS